MALPTTINQETRFQELPTGGRLILWAARHWMLAYRRGRPVGRCVWQSFAAQGLSAAYAELCGLLTIVAFREFPAEQFAAPDGGALAPVEHDFVELLAALETADGDAALRLLEGRTVPSVARAIAGKAARLTLLLNGAGLWVGEIAASDVVHEVAGGRAYPQAMRVH